MVHITISNRFDASGITSHKRNHKDEVKIFTVQVMGFDGDYTEYEVSADSEDEASAKGQSMAASEGIEISYVEVFRQ